MRWWSCYIHKKHSEASTVVRTTREICRSWTRSHYNQIDPAQTSTLCGGSGGVSTTIGKCGLVHQVRRSSGGSLHGRGIDYHGRSQRRHQKGRYQSRQGTHELSSCGGYENPLNRTHAHHGHQPNMLGYYSHGCSYPV